MAINATVVTITQPGATGNQTYSLPANFDPKAIIVLGSINNGSNGAVAQGSLCIGFGTYRGAAVQQMWMAMTSQDNAVANTFGRTGNDAVMKLTNGQNNTIVSNVTLVSMQTGATSQFVLNWVTRDTTNTSKKILVLVLGGSDITDAMCGTFFTGTGGAGDQDVTVATGFGKPDVLFVGHGGDTTQPTTFGGGSPFSFAFNNQNPGGRLLLSNHVDSAAAADVRQRMDNNKILYGGLSGTVTHDAVLAAVANWPTDGFRFTYTTRSVTWPVDYLALRLSANAVATVGQNTVPASGSQSLAGSSGQARALFGMSARLTSINTDVTTGADNGYNSYGVAANDATQGLVGMLDLDGANPAVTDSMFDASKFMNLYNPTGEAKTAETGASASGANFNLDWSDPDSSAWIYQWLMISEIVASSGPGGSFFPFLDPIPT